MMSGATRAKRVRRSLWIIAVVAVGGSWIAACGGSRAASPEGSLTGDQEERVSSFCIDAELATGSAHPFDAIEVLGLAAGGERPISEVFGIYRAADGQETVVPGRLSPSREGAELVITVPPHPEGLAGGAGELHLTDSKGLKCPPLDLEIESIPTASGTTARVADLLDELIRTRTQAYGLDPDVLLSTPSEELPLVALPQAMALWGLNGPDNPESLRATLAASPETELLDALLSHRTVPQLLEQEINSLRESASEPSRIASTATYPTLRQVISNGSFQDQAPWLQPLTTLAMMQGAPPRNYTRQVIDIPPVSITNAEELSGYMRAQLEAAGTASGATGQLLNDTEYAFIVIGIWAPTIGAAADAAVFVYLKSLESDQKLLPCCFKSIEYELESPYFEEDYEFPPKYAKWGKAKVVAHNLGWNLTETAITAAEKTLGLSAGFKKSHENWDNWLTEVATGKNPGGPDFKGGIEGAGQNYAHNWAKANKIPDIGALTIPPFTWPPIDVTHAQWTKAKAEGAIQTVSTHGYAPRDLGSGKLTVETIRGKFGNAHKALAKLVDVREIIVSVTPSVLRVEPGDELRMRAFVRNSVHPEMLKWKFITANGASVELLASNHEGGGAHYADIRLPRDEEAFPIEVEAESTSRTGLRRNATARRYGSATLTTGVVVDIGPEPACVEKGKTLQMFAEVVGAENTEVKWSVLSGPGRINRAGVVTATGDGEVEIRGTSAADDRAYDDATIEVGKCTCTFSATLSGDTGKTNAQGKVAHFSTAGKATIMGAFSNPEALEDVMGVFGEMMGEEQKQRAEEWKKEMESMPRVTLGVALMEMDPKGANEQMMADFVGGFKLQASVMNQPVEEGFAGGLNLSHVVIHTGEYTEGGYPTKYEWAPGAPGNVNFIVSHYNGRSLSGTMTGNMFAPGLYKTPSGDPPQISFSVYFYALDFDPLNMRMGCLR